MAIVCTVFHKNISFSTAVNQQPALDATQRDPQINMQVIPTIIEHPFSIVVQTCHRIGCTQIDNWRKISFPAALFDPRSYTELSAIVLSLVVELVKLDYPAFQLQYSTIETNLSYINCAPTPTSCPRTHRLRRDSHLKSN